MPMAKEFDPEVVRQVLAQIEAERVQELTAPVKAVRLHDTIAEWGTGGLKVGLALGLVIVALIFVVDYIPLTLKALLGLTMFFGTLAIPGALGGMLVGLVIWLVRR